MTIFAEKTKATTDWLTLGEVMKDDSKLMYKKEGNYLYLYEDEKRVKVAITGLIAKKDWKEVQSFFYLLRHVQ